MLVYLSSFIMGSTLGLLGGGGSILAVPILVYLIGLDSKVAIALSLGIVGVTSLIGLFSHYKNKNIDFKIATIFAPFAMLGTYVGAKLSVYISGNIQMALFAIIMIIAAIFMFKGKKESQSSHDKKINLALVSAEGIGVGVLTGVVGVGGGFMIVPALMMLGHIEMKRAVGTSLLIIALKSFAGFYGYLGVVEIPWKLFLEFIIFSGVGVLFGAYFANKVPQKILKKIFAVFLIVMGSYILLR